MVLYFFIYGIILGATRHLTNSPQLFTFSVCLLAISVLALGERFDVEALVDDGVAAVGEV